MNVWPIIRALTLHRPWDRYMAHGRKPIENREWMPPEWMLQQLIALHAGQADWRWFFGRYGWVVADPAGGRAQPLGKPVAARGFQKLWHLPAEAEAAVLEQVKVA